MSTKADDKSTSKDDQEKKDDATKVDEKSKSADGKKSDDSKSDDTDKKPAKTEKTFTKAELEAEKQKAINEAKKKWDDEKDLTELERLQKENQSLKEANQMRDAKDEVVAALSTAGSNSPALAFEAIKGSLKFDDAGKLINGKDLIDGLKASFPEQFGTPKPQEGIDAGKGGQPSEKLTSEKLAKMTPDEINKLDWKEVSAVLSEA